MKVVRRLQPLFAAILPLAGVAAGPGPGITLPCEPSRVCAIGMARAAAYENERRGYGSYGKMHGLLGIAELQLESGDMTGFESTVTELIHAAAVDKYPSTHIDHLAGLLARAGRFEEALATAADGRTRGEREFAYQYVAEELARRGRWREAVSARTVAHAGNLEYAQYRVMQDLTRAGSREWVMDALPALVPDRQVELLSEFERHNGNLGAAIGHLARIDDRERRWSQVLAIVDAATATRSWDDLAAVARLAAAEGLSKGAEGVRNHRLQYANEWLCAAGRHDEALALLAKAPEDLRQYMKGMTASCLAAANQYDRARELLEGLDAERKAETLKRIATVSVLAGDQRFDRAITAFPEPRERFQTLLTWAEQLPEGRSRDAREILRAAMKLAGGRDNVARAAELAYTGELQAARGFIHDALVTAARLEKADGKYRAHNLARLHAAIMKAQAARGDRVGSRKTLATLEPLLRDPGINGQLHAGIISDLTSAGYLDEAFEQVKVLTRRESTDGWYRDGMFPVIRAYVSSGEPRRAFEIAVMLSEHARGDADYFLEIARSLDR